MSDTRDAILGEIQALRAELARIESRDHARRIRDGVVALVAATCMVEVVGDVVDLAGLQRIVLEFQDEARAKILKDFGTSAWDEPETVEAAKARMGTLPAAPGPGVLDRVSEREPPPLTDEELNTIALEVDGWSLWGMTWQGVPRVTPEHASWLGLRLVAEVRRLHSDEWLTAAAREIEEKSAGGCDVPADEGLTILRKHRDGK